MTNKEWLDYLAHNAPDELAAWFDAEHAESPTSVTMQHIGQIIESTVNRGVYGDTAAQNEDSREQLEADVRSYFPRREECAETIIGWLDRQAAITAHQWESYHNGMILEWMAKTEELQAQVDAKDSCIENIMQTLRETQTRASNLADDLLTANNERDNLKASCEDWKKHARAAENACYETMLEREDYRKKFGKCIDYADAIHALMDDEGMA